MLPTYVQLPPPASFTSRWVWRSPPKWWDYLSLTYQKMITLTKRHTNRCPPGRAADRGRRPLPHSSSRHPRFPQSSRPSPGRFLTTTTRSRIPPQGERDEAVRASERCANPVISPSSIFTATITDCITPLMHILSPYAGRRRDTFTASGADHPRRYCASSISRNGWWVRVPLQHHLTKLTRATVWPL